MTSPFIVVWRQTEGAALSTYTQGDKKPRVFTESQASDSDVQGSEEISKDALIELTKSREEFGKKRIPATLAVHVLGWSIENTLEEGAKA